MLQVIEYIPGWEGTSFVQEKKQTNKYDAVNFLLSESYYKWDYDSDYWIGTEQNEYDSKEEGSILFDWKNSLWNVQEQQWIGNFFAEYIAESVRSVDEVMNWEFLETYLPVYAFDGIICDKVQYYISKDEAWIEANFVDYYFSDKIVNADAFLLSEVKIYPNPVSNILNIETNSFESLSCIIRNINGQVVIQKNVDGRDQINISNLRAGFYFVELQNQTERIYSGKIIKQ